MYVVTKKFSIHPGREEAEQVFAESLAEIESDEPGTLVFTFQRHKRKERTYVAYEIYRDKDRFKAHVDRMSSSPASSRMREVIATSGVARAPRAGRRARRTDLNAIMIGMLVLTNPTHAT